MKTAAFFAAELDRAIAPLVTFIDEHRHDLINGREFGVERVSIT